MIYRKTYLNTFSFWAICTNNGHFEGFDNVFYIGRQGHSCSPFSVYPEKSGGQFVFFNYDHKNQIEDLATKKTSPVNFPDVLFFEVQQETHFKQLNEIISFENSSVGTIKITAKTSKTDYIQNVNKLKEHIQQGDIYEINYCITFEAKNVTIDPFEVFNKLNSVSKAPYSALVKLEDKFIISASPELFLSKRGNKLITKPIKGTAKRGASAEEDESLKKELLQSVKERTENVMIVDVSRNDLSRIAKKGTVKVDKLYDIESYKQVHQMVSTVSCELKEDISFNDIIKATFPMASMTGAPKIRAMELIDDLETYNRGPYSGCMGYINKNGDFDLSVLIRSIFYDEKEKYLSFSVGSAITALCDPEKEYEECLLKAAAMKKVLEG